MPTQAQAQANSNQSQQLTTLEQEQLNNFLGPIDGAVGGLPVAERTSEYFAVFTGAGGTGPEIIDQTAVFISYLVDAKGNLSKPSTEYVSLDNLLQNFEVGKNVVLRNGTPAIVNGNIFGKQKITGIGRQVPLLYSATGSTPGAHVDSLNFDSDLNQPSTPSMLGKMIRGQINPGAAYSVPQTITGYNTPEIIPDSTAAEYNPTTGTYSIFTSGIGDTNVLKFKILGEFTNTDDQNHTVLLRIRKDGSMVAQKTYTIPSDDSLNIANGNDPFEFFAFGNFLQGSPVYDLQVSFPYAGNAIQANLFIEFLNFEVSQQTPQGGFIDATSPFFTTGSGEENLFLTASAQLSANYNNIQNSDPVTDLASANDFNLSSINTPFNVKVGDRIRFEYNMETDFIIYEVIEPDAANDGKLKLKLNQRIPETVNLDNFILHRVDSNDPVYIILDVKKGDLNPPNTPFKGVMLPEYPTKELKDNIDDLVLELKEKGILPDE